MPLILPGNVASATAEAYEVANSCRFNDGDDAYMHKTPGGAGNRRKFTFSTWLKRSNITLGSQALLFAAGADTSNWTIFRITTTDELQMYFNTGTLANLITSLKLRDPSAWYHIVWAIDTEQATEANRAKLYVNGTQVTAFGTETYPSEDEDLDISSTEQHYIGGGQSRPLDGYLAETVFIDGLQLAPTSFGEFDSDSPTIWKPKDVSGLTFGTNGFYLDFEASDNLGNDANGGTDLTEVNLDATDQATDTPTNNFCTMNPLNQRLTYPATFSQGNCQMTTSGDWGSWSTSMGSVNGKWYWEAKRNGSTATLMGILSENATNTTGNAGTNGLLGTSTQYQGVGYHQTGKIYPGSGGSSASWGAGYSANDIISVAMDLDNGKLYFAINGTWSDSGDPTSGATGTGSAKDLTVGTEFFFPSLGSYADGEGWSGNFGGCSSFTVSSANQDANGYGNFEYAVPSGYFALCSKNLAEYG